MSIIGLYRETNNSHPTRYGPANSHQRDRDRSLPNGPDEEGR